MLLLLGGLLLVVIICLRVLGKVLLPLGRVVCGRASSTRHCNPRRIGRALQGGWRALSAIASIASITTAIATSVACTRSVVARALSLAVGVSAPTVASLRRIVLVPLVLFFDVPKKVFA